VPANGDLVSGETASQVSRRSLHLEPLTCDAGHSLVRWANKLIAM
jgi:hypothetical protein